MQSLPKSTVLSKVLVVTTLVAFVLYAVGGLVSQWLTTTFKLPANPPAVPVPLDVDVHMGLLESCSVQNAMGNVVSEDCSSDGAKDWQKISAGVAFVGAVSAVVVLVLVVLNVTVNKVAGRRAVKLAIAGLSFLAAVMMGIALILYGLNKKIQVVPPLPLKVDFDLGWAYVLAGIGSGFFLVVMLIALIDSCSSSDNTVDMHTFNGKSGNEPAVHYTNHAMSS